MTLPTLGFVSAHFESSGRGPGTISSGSGDPGGKSYGIFQFSGKTLVDYTRQAAFSFMFMPTSDKFDLEWIAATEKYTEEFALDQWLFTTKRLYMPAIVYARQLGFQTWSKKIQEAIFSIAVQHGGYKTIISEAPPSAEMQPDDEVAGLYTARIAYVKKLGFDSKLLASLLYRYAQEVALVLSIDEQVPAVMQ